MIINMIPHVSSFLEDMLKIIKSNFSAGSKEACETR